MLFCYTGQFLLHRINAALRERLVGLNEIIGRLTCFMTMDHWLTLELHKNNHFYTKCFSDDTRQERGESDCEMSSVAKPITHITSCLRGTKCLGRGSFTNKSTHSFFFFYCAPPHSAHTGIMSCAIIVSVLVT